MRLSDNVLDVIRAKWFICENEFYSLSDLSGHDLGFEIDLDLHFIRIRDYPISMSRLDSFRVRSARMP